MIMRPGLLEVLFDFDLDALLDEPVRRRSDNYDLHGDSLDASRFRVSRRGKVN